MRLRTSTLAVATALIFTAPAPPVSGGAVALPDTGRAAVSAEARFADARFDEARRLIEETLREDGISSVAVSVARRGEFIWEEGFGWADRERQVRATAHTPYSTASISKPVTATAIMMLAERGELDLDRPANDYLSPTGQIRVFQGSADQVTVRRILSHTAGLPLHYQFFYEGADYGAPPSDVSIQRFGVVVHPPGARYAYSNIGYGILDRIVERVSGQSFGDFLQREVFTPLGMNRTSLDIRPGLEEYAAARYGARQERLPFYTFDHPGASAVYASAHDLVRFGHFHLGIPLEGQREILNGASRAAMQRIETPDGSERGYGLGWILAEDHGGFRMISHSGGMPGVATLLQMYPTEDLVIAVMTNGQPWRAGRVADAIAAAVIPGFRVEEPSEAAATERPDFVPPASLVGRWEGKIETYDRSVDIWMEVRQDGDVHVKLGDQHVTVLSNPRLDDGIFRGVFAGRIPAPDMERHLHEVMLEATLSGNTLRGAATARATEDPIHFALSSYIEMTRAR